MLNPNFRNASMSAICRFASVVRRKIWPAGLRSREYGANRMAGPSGYACSSLSGAVTALARSMRDAATASDSYARFSPYRMRYTFPLGVARTSVPSGYVIENHRCQILHRIRFPWMCGV